MLKTTPSSFGVIVTLLLAVLVNRPVKAAPPDFGEVYIRSLSFSGDGKSVASADASGQVKLWDVGTGKLRLTLGQHEDGIQRVAFSPRQDLLVTAGEKGIGVWDATAGTLKRTLGAYSTDVNAMAVSPDGKLLAVSSYQYQSPFDTVTLWDVATGKSAWAMKLTHKELLGSAKELAFSPDGKLLAVGIQDFLNEFTTKTRSAFRLLDLHTKRLLPLSAIASKGYNPSITSLAFSPSGTTIVTGGTDVSPSNGGLRHGVVRLWQTKTGKMQKVLARGLESAGGVRTAFSPSGRLVAVASGGNPNPWEPDQPYILQLFDVRSGKLMRTLHGEYGAHFNTIAYSPRGDYIATQGKDVGIHLWPVSPK